MSVSFYGSETSGRRNRIGFQKIKSKAISLDCIVTTILFNILIQNVFAMPISNEEKTSTISDQKNVAITIYNEDLAW